MQLVVWVVSGKVWSIRKFQKRLQTLLSEGNFIVCYTVERIILSPSIGQIIIILSFRVDTSKNKNIDHRVKKTCAILSTQVTYETKPTTSIYSMIQQCQVH